MESCYLLFSIINQAISETLYENFRVSCTRLITACRSMEIIRPHDWWILSNFLILPTARVYSACYRNEYQEHKKEYFWGVEHDRCARLTTSPPYVSHSSRQCANLNISQPYRLPWPVTGIALFFICRWCSYLTGNTCRPPRPVTGITLL
jgi:hypothetical protein